MAPLTHPAQASKRHAGPGRQSRQRCAAAFQKQLSIEPVRAQRDAALREADGFTDMPRPGSAAHEQPLAAAGLRRCYRTPGAATAAAVTSRLPAHPSDDRNVPDLQARASLQVMEANLAPSWRGVELTRLRIHRLGGRRLTRASCRCRAGPRRFARGLLRVMRGVTATLMVESVMFTCSRHAEHFLRAVITQGPQVQTSAAG